MTERDFVFWIQGLLELSPDTKTLDEKQVAMIRQHLGYVFQHQAQPAVAPRPLTTEEAQHQEMLDKIADQVRRMNPHSHSIIGGSPIGVSGIITC